MLDYTKYNRFLWLLLPVLLFLLVNLLSLSLKHKFDFTEGKYHSLSPTTKDYLRGLKHTVALDLIFTGSNDNIPFEIRMHHAHVVDTLERMEKLSDGNLKISFRDPSQDAAAMEKVEFDGLTELFFTQGKSNYFGLTARCLSQDSLIPYFHPDRSHLLEYDLLLLLDQVVPRQREKVGLVSGLPVTGAASSTGNELSPWLFVKELGRSYEVVNYSNDLPSLQTHSPEVLIVIHPIGFGASLEKAIDEYLQSGGNLIIALDPHCITPTFLNKSPGEEYMDMASSDLRSLMAGWGVQYSSTSVVADMNYSSEINRGYGSEMLHTVLTLPSEVISRESPVTRGVDNLGFAFSGFFNMHPDHPWAVATPLVFSSQNSSAVESEELHQITRKENLSLMNRFVADGAPKAIVVELTGNVPPVFESTTRSASSKASRIILIGDTDFIFDAFAGESQQVGENTTQINPYNGNLALLNNAVDSLLDRSTLSIARNRGLKRQPFTGLNQLRASIVSSHQDERAQLEAQLVRLNREKEKMFLHSSDQTVDEQIALNKNIKKKDKEIRKVQLQLEHLEVSISRSTASLITRIQWVNILIVPVLIIFAGSVSVLFRIQSTKAR